MCLFFGTGFREALEFYFFQALGNILNSPFHLENRLRVLLFDVFRLRAFAQFEAVEGQRLEIFKLGDCQLCTCGAAVASFLNNERMEQKLRGP